MYLISRKVLSGVNQQAIREIGESSETTCETTKVDDIVRS